MILFPYTFYNNNYLAYFVAKSLNSRYQNNEGNGELEKIAKNMKDEFVSVEHIFMGIIDKPTSQIKSLLNRYSIDKDAFLIILLSFAAIIPPLRYNKFYLFCKITNMQKAARNGRLEII